MRPGFLSVPVFSCTDAETLGIPTDNFNQLPYLFLTGEA